MNSARTVAQAYVDRLRAHNEWLEVQRVGGYITLTAGGDELKFLEATLATLLGEGKLEVQKSAGWRYWRVKP